MEQVRVLAQLSVKTAPGRAPDYTPAHLLYALSLFNERRIGRKQLSEELRLGEGTVRTIISRLVEEGLVEVSRPGVSLSSKGSLFLENILSQIGWFNYPSSDITVAENNFVVIIKGASDAIRYGVEQRDQALIHGAVGATTLVRIKGQWFMPGLDEKTELVMPEHLIPEDGDVAIIGSGYDDFTAKLGAFSAALKIIF